MAALGWPASDLRYDPLAKDSIRLLRVWRRDDGTIEGELRNVSFQADDRPSYLALSYFCGRKSSERSIVLNGVPVPVLPTIYPFLELACDDTTSFLGAGQEWLWIDSMCIDSGNKQERNSQVAKMGDIYREAEKTIVWLGDESDDSARAFEFLKTLRRRRVDIGEVKAVVEELRSPQMRENWDAVGKFLLRPWWRRTWTLQEFIVSRQVDFHCGAHSVISRHDLMPAIYAAWLCNYDESLLDRPAYYQAWNRRRLLQWYKYGQMPLIGLMAYMGDLEATDMKDRIYSLLALARPTDKDRVVKEPDYGSDVELIYCRLVESFVETYGSLDIVCLAHIFRKKTSGRGDAADLTPTSLPSWVPDWRERVESHVVPLMVSQSARDHIGNFRPLQYLSWNATYQASNVSSAGHVRFSKDKREMECDGVLLDFIDGLGGLQAVSDGGHIGDQHTGERREEGEDDDGPAPHVPSTSDRNNRATKPADFHPYLPSPASAADDDPANVARFLEMVCTCVVLDREDKYLRNSMPKHFLADFETFCRAALTRPREVDSWFVQWFELNKNLCIGGVSLESVLTSNGSSSSDTATSMNNDPSLPASAYPAPVAGLAPSDPNWHSGDGAARPSLSPSLTDHSNWSSFLARFLDTTRKKRRRLFVTDQGLIGMGPHRAREGDVVAVLFGCSVPVVLRERRGPPPSLSSLNEAAAAAAAEPGLEADDDRDPPATFEFVGECYTYGYMNAEVHDEIDRGVRNVQTFKFL